MSDREKGSDSELPVPCKIYTDGDMNRQENRKRGRVLNKYMHKIHKYFFHTRRTKVQRHWHPDSEMHAISCTVQ